MVIDHADYLCDVVEGPTFCAPLIYFITDAEETRIPFVKLITYTYGKLQTQ